MRTKRFSARMKRFSAPVQICLQRFGLRHLRLQHLHAAGLELQTPTGRGGVNDRGAGAREPPAICYASKGFMTYPTRELSKQPQFALSLRIS